MKLNLIFIFLICIISSSGYIWIVADKLNLYSNSRIEIYYNKYNSSSFIRVNLPSGNISTIVMQNCTIGDNVTINLIDDFYVNGFTFEPNRNYYAYKTQNYHIYQEPKSRSKYVWKEVSNLSRPKDIRRLI